MGDDDVCQYVIRRPLPQKEGKKQKFAGDSSHASEEASQARSEEKEGREEQAGCRRVRQDLGSETEGGQGGQRAEEEEVRLPPRVQEIRLQPVKARCHRDLVTRK